MYENDIRSLLHIFFLKFVPFEESTGLCVDRKYDVFNKAMDVAQVRPSSLWHIFNDFSLS